MHTDVSERSNVPADNDRSIFLSTCRPRGAIALLRLPIVGISAILFALAVPFAGMPLTPMPAFVASYQSALAINDHHHRHPAVLAIRHPAQSRALLLLASGYLFTAAAAVDPRLDLSRACSRRPDCSAPDRRPRSGST